MFGFNESRVHSLNVFICWPSFPSQLLAVSLHVPGDKNTVNQQEASREEGRIFAGTPTLLLCGQTSSSQGAAFPPPSLDIKNVAAGEEGDVCWFIFWEVSVKL